MGISCSLPLAFYCELENTIDSVIRNPIDHGDGEQKICEDLQPVTLLSLGREKVLVEGSVGFGVIIAQPGIYSNVSSEDKYMFCDLVSRLRSEGRIKNSPIVCSRSPTDEAAIRLQKVYKSFRTRRKLADCAVLIEQSWWKLLDFAELKHSSISFFDLEKHETALSRWSRARTRAAKVGKGLSKNSKAQKLALQHWLEAIDPRHRYGHNLHQYYVKWLNSQSKEPFFYWLDIGEGKEVNLIEKCPRLKLQKQCIKYLGPLERKVYEVTVEDGILYHRKTGELLDTIGDPFDTKWIFVLSTSRILYVGKKKKGLFQHSSFLAGGATLAAGRIIAEKGILKAVWPHSGHYMPTQENFLDFISFLRENNVDLSNVKLDSIDNETDDSFRNKSRVYLKSNSSEDDSDEKDTSEKEENWIDSSSFKIRSSEQNDSAEFRKPVSSISQGIKEKPSALLVPSNHDLIEILQSETHKPASKTSFFHLESPTNEHEPSENPFECSIEHVNPSEDSYKIEDVIISEETIFQRINSHKETRSYQLGKHLSYSWSSGAGPRIGCLRDYPLDLQNHALEQLNLSPRSERLLRIHFSSRGTTPNGSILSRCEDC